MIGIRSAALAIATSAAGLAAASTATQAAPAVSYGGVGQHQAVMGNIYRAQQRNNAAISHVQNNIRSSRTRTY